VATFHLADAWEAVADAIPDEPALVHGSTIRTWREFDQRSARLAAGLRDIGVGEGSVVAIDLFNCNEYLESFAAAIKVRAVPANLNFRYLGDELHQLLEKAEAEVVVFHASLAERVFSATSRGLPKLRALVQVDDGDAPEGTDVLDYEEFIDGHPPASRISRSGEDSFLIYTGGTTGLPKGVMFQIGLATPAFMMMRPLLLGLPIAADTDPAEVAVALRQRGELPAAVPAAPLMHATGLGYVSFTALAAGGSVVTLEQRSFDPHELLSVVQRRRVSMIGIVGDAFALPIVRALDEAVAAGEPYDTSSLRSICSAGVAWSAQVKNRLFDHIPQVLLSDSCGATDGAGLYGNQMTRKGDVATTATFQPGPGVKVLDESRREVPVGEIGYLAVPTTATGYFRDPEATARTYFDIDGVSYSMPGDLGRIGADGMVTLIGRGTSVINTGGEKVFPEEVEDIIKQIDGVSDCLVFGTPDERLGQQVTAIAEADAGTAVTSEQIIDATKQRIAGYKAPRWVILASVPRFPNGKPDFQTARSLVGGGQS
jgi:fatty-acyl-CoA synthase